MRKLLRRFPGFFTSGIPVLLLLFASFAAAQNKSGESPQVTGGTRAASSENAADGAQFENPPQGFAAHYIEVPIRGHARGRWFGFAPARSARQQSAENPYSAVVLTGKETKVRLVVPIHPGDYELRYRDARKPFTIFRTVPFKSLQPSIEIHAPAQAGPGDKLPVRVTGNIGETMGLTVVLAGSPAKTRSGSSANLRQGAEDSVSIYKLPAEPGEYEIRCLSSWGNPVVYSRRKITLR